MKTFRIRYCFEGEGKIKIGASDKKEAMDIFYGESDTLEECGKNYSIISVEEITTK